MNDLKQLQHHLLEILVEIKRVCEKNNIHYYLIGGTLLGAARNGEFIPWDDDIDIGMTRENFIRFEQIANEQLNKKFFFQTPITDPECSTYCCGRVRLEGSTFISNSLPNNWKHNGIFVDILPYDKVTKNKILEKIFFYRFNLITRILWKRKGYRPHPSNKMFRLIMNVFTFIYKPISTKYLEKKVANYYKKYINLKNYDRIELLNCHSRAFKSELVENLSVLKFEGQDYPVPFDYDAYLTNQYGDWRTLPPIEQQIPHHIDYTVNVGN